MRDRGRDRVGDEVEEGSPIDDQPDASNDSGRSVAEILARLHAERADEGVDFHPDELTLPDYSPNSSGAHVADGSAGQTRDAESEVPDPDSEIPAPARDSIPQPGPTLVAKSAAVSSQDATATPIVAANGGDKVRTAMRGIGQTLITFGVVVLLFIVYEAFITDIFNAREQAELSKELEQEWAQEPVPAPEQEQSVNFADVAVGDAFAIMRVPAFGADYAQVIVQGTTTAALEKGPGHYAHTAGPGEVGNFAIAGHRVGKGSPFLNLDKLKPGDAIVFETQTNWYVYRVIGNKDTGDFTDPAYPVSGQQITTPSHYEVIAPVPGDEAATPTQKLLTLTTCHPKFSAAERLIVHAYLEGEPLPKSQYPNPEDVPAMKGN